MFYLQSANYLVAFNKSRSESLIERIVEIESAGRWRGASSELSETTAKCFAKFLRLSNNGLARLNNCAKPILVRIDSAARALLSCRQHLCVSARLLGNISAPGNNLQTVAGAILVASSAFEFRAWSSSTLSQEFRCRQKPQPPRKKEVRLVECSYQVTNRGMMWWKNQSIKAGFEIDGARPSTQNWMDIPKKIHREDRFFLWDFAPWSA